MGVVAESINHLIISTNQNWTQTAKKTLLRFSSPFLFLTNKAESASAAFEHTRI